MAVGSYLARWESGRIQFYKEARQMGSEKWRLISGILAAILVASVLAAGAAQAAIITVGPGGPPTYDHATIQAAINAASGGDVISVAAGTYVENLSIPPGKDTLKLIGHSKDDTILAPASGTAITVGSPVTIKGFHINQSDAGSAILIAWGSSGVSGTETDPGVIEDNKIESPTDNRGNGINYKDYVSEYWEIKNNVLINRKLAIYLNQASHLLISGNTLTGYKEGIGMNWNGEPAHHLTITSNNFNGTNYPFTPTEQLEKAAIMLGEISHDVEISDNQITGSPGGIRIPDDSGSANLANVVIQGNTFTNNQSFQFMDEPGVLDIEQILANNTFDRAVTVDRPGGSLLHTIWSKIQDGIDNAVASDTINVAAGTYDEYLSIQKSIHLVGEDKKTTILTYTGTPTVEQLIMLGWNTGGTLAGGATVQGFKLLADEGLYGDKDLIKLRANGASGAPIVIKDNIFQGDGVTRYVGIETAYDAGYVKVENNELDDLAYGAWFNVLINGEIKGNTITDTIWSALAINTSDPDKTHDIDILGNTILRTGVGTGSPKWSAGLHLGSTIYNVQVTENTISDGYDHGVYVMDRTTVVMTDVHINNNDIYNNCLGSVNEVCTAVDATNNWWGHPTGPYHPTSWSYDSQVITNPDGKGDEVSDYVLYDPWYWPTTPMASFVVDYAKIDFKKKPDDDKVRVQGELELDTINGDGVYISENVIVTVGPLSETITLVEKGKKADKWVYKRPKDGTGDIKHMTIDWKNGKFDIHMDKADLAGVTNPVTITIQIGDDVGSESILMREKKHHWDYKAEKFKKTEAVEIEPFAMTGQVKVVAYPNPVRDVDTATFQAMGTLAAQVEEIRVQIYDLSGRLVWEDAAPGSELDWHTDCLSGDYLANGIYLYRVQLRIDGTWISQDIGKIAVLR